MKNTRDPNEPLLFDNTTVGLTSVARNLLKGSWWELMRTAILRLMPVETIGAKLSEKTGRPSKELYSVCALLFVKDYQGWTFREAVERYVFDMRVRYAFNIQECGPGMSEATLYRYSKLFTENKAGEEIFTRVTLALVESMSIDTARQRLDSTHVNGNMAVLSRKALVYNVIQNFLAQLKRRFATEYGRLPQDLLDRYGRHDGWIFAESAGMRRKGVAKSMDASVLVADLLLLAGRFGDKAGISDMTSFKHLLRVLDEQVETKAGRQEDAKAGRQEDGAPALKRHTGGKVLCNPSDPDAEIGHKGPGYQVQVSETYGDGDKPSLVTTVVPQGGSEADSASLGAVLDAAEKNGVKPERLLCDAGYGSNANVGMAAERGVGLVSPCTCSASLASHDGSYIDLCTFDGTNRMTACANGVAPLSCKRYGSKRGLPAQWRAVFRPEDCEGCPFRERCPARRHRRKMAFNYLDSQAATKRRREHEKTDEFREEYRPRSGVEATFGRLKQFTPLRRLRVRGRDRVFSQIWTIFAMHNIMQSFAYIFRNGLDVLAAAAAASGMGRMTPDAVAEGLERLFAWLWRALDIFSDRNPEFRMVFPNISETWMICV